jgi:HAD superfamily hydrolase (TIGR01484 family)
MWSEVVALTRGVFSDVDDTLTHAGTLVPEAYDALCRARRTGLRIILVTGRPAGWAEVLAAVLPIDAAIGENGAVAALPGGGRYYYEDEAARSSGARRRAEALARAQREVPEARLSTDHRLREIDLAFDIAEHARLPEPLIDKLTSVLHDAGLRTTRSSIHLHGSFSAADKASMSARVAAHLWNEPVAEVRDRYLFVGDSPNDAPAFAFFKHTIGVANVRQSVAAFEAMGAVPWAVTRAHGGHGFAELIDRLLSTR